MGSSSQNTQTSQQQQGQTNPYGPTVDPINSLIGNISSSANMLPNFGPQAGGVANNLLSGVPDMNANLTGAYGNLQQQLSPFLNFNNLDPTKTPGISNALDTVRNDVTNSVNGMFAGAGRDLSGMNTQTLARGISQGEAPILLGQYNTNVGNYMNAANSLYGAAGSTNQGLLGNIQAGLTTAQGTPGLTNNNAALEQLLGPLAGLGGSYNSSGSGTSNTTSTASPLQNMLMASMAFSNILKPFNFGSPSPS